MDISEREEWAAWCEEQEAAIEAQLVAHENAQYERMIDDDEAEALAENAEREARAS